MYKERPYPGIAPGGYSIHYTNTNPNPYPGLILDNARKTPAAIAAVNIWGASVHAAAAGIIAADFTAVPTDSPLPVGVAQRLPAASQRC